MILHRLLSAITRQERSKLNENFDRIERSYKGVIDTSNEARDKSTIALKVANGIDGKATEALEKSKYAVDKSIESNRIAEQVEITAEATSKQLDDILREPGMSDAEVVAMRTDRNNGETFVTAGNRLDNMSGTLSKKETRDLIYRKKIVHELPFRFPDYDAALALEPVNYMFPQGLAIDGKTNEIFVAYWSEEVFGNWIAVFDFKTGAYKSCFRLNPNDGEAANLGEGLVLRYESGKRYLYSKVTALKISKFDITVLPDNLSYNKPTATFDCGVRQHYAFHHDKWFVQQANIATENNKGLVYYIYDNDFVKRSVFILDTSIGGYRGGALSRLGTKTQGIAALNSYIIQVEGGATSLETETSAYHQHGIKIIDLDGQIVENGIFEPKKGIGILNEAGYDVDFIEYEAITTVDQKVYTLCLIKDSTVGGILIFEEFCEDADAINFATAKSNHLKVNRPLIMSEHLFPLGRDGKLTHPLTGENLNTLDKILDFMNEASLRQLNFHTFYAMGITSTITNLTTIPENTLFEITAIDTVRFFVRISGQTSYSTQEFSVRGSSGSRIAHNLTNPSQNGWQKHKLTNDNGSVIYPPDTIANFDTLAPGNYYITGGLSSKVADFPLAGSPGFLDVMHVDNANKIIRFRSSYDNVYGGATYEKTILSGVHSAWHQVNKTIHGSINPEGREHAARGTFYYMASSPVRLFIKTTAIGNVGWKEMSLL